MSFFLSVCGHIGDAIVQLPHLLAAVINLRQAKECGNTPIFQTDKFVIVNSHSAANEHNANRARLE